MQVSAYFNILLCSFKNSHQDGLKVVLILDKLLPWLIACVKLHLQQSAPSPTLAPALRKPQGSTKAGHKNLCKRAFG